MFGSGSSCSLNLATASFITCSVVMFVETGIVREEGDTNIPSRKSGTGYLSIKLYQMRAPFPKKIFGPTAEGTGTSMQKWSKYKKHFKQKKLQSLVLYHWSNKVRKNQHKCPKGLIVRARTFLTTKGCVQFENFRFVYFSGGCQIGLQIWSKHMRDHCG